MTSFVPINFRESFAKFGEHWSPKVVAELNDYQFKLVKVQGEFVWHAHEDTDEAFLVMEGQMTIAFEEGAVNLSAGEMFVVPKGVRHKPFARQECHVLLIEPRGVVNTGDAASEMTAPNDVWV